VFQPPPPDFGTEYFIHYAGVSQTETSLLFWLAELVPSDKRYFLLPVEALPEEIPLHAFDGNENEFWGCQSREDIDQKGLEDESFTICDSLNLELASVVYQIFHKEYKHAYGLCLQIFYPHIFLVLLTYIYDALNHMHNHKPMCIYHTYILQLTYIF